MKSLLYLTVILVVIATIFFIQSCKNNQVETEQPPEEKQVEVMKALVPEWHKNANIYEVNIRNYTPEGTFNAFAKHLPRLQKMGVDILWLMPIHEISETNRKGELGSPYAVTDYKGVNPDFGTITDFELMIGQIHALGMKCIIDWVPNHTGWDNPWLKEHPEWFTKDTLGNITDPFDQNTGKSWGWTDVADLNFDNSEMRLAMIDALKFWVNEMKVDGFRFDVAHAVPVDFWKQCTKALYDVKPLFLLGEAAVPELRNKGYFIMDYAWEMHHTLNEIAKAQGANRNQTAKLVQGNLVDEEGAEIEKKTALDIDTVLNKYKKQYTQGYAMHFTSNHDENFWAGTEFERMGDGHKAFAVLCATFDGMPLVYSGQESAFDRRLEFFKKDQIDWGTYAYTDFYTTLLKLKHENEAIWNGEYGGELVKIPTGDDQNIYAFYRAKGQSKVLVILNLSAKGREMNFAGEGYEGNYKEVFQDRIDQIAPGMTIGLKPWDYLVYEKI